MKKVFGRCSMPRYVVTLTDDEIQELKELVQKGGKGYRIKHAQILLKLDSKPNNAGWTYERIQEAYSASHGTIAGIAKRFVTDGLVRLEVVGSITDSTVCRVMKKMNLSHGL